MGVIMPLVVRPERADPAEVAAVRGVVAAAFGDDGEHVAALLDDLRAGDAWRGLSFVAEAGGDVLGHVSYSRAWLDAPSQLVEVLVLSPLSVHPDVQRRGIGSRLVTDSLVALRSRPEPLVFLEGSPDLYPRFGFTPGRDHGFVRPSVRIPEPAFQVHRLRPAVGLRGALVYPDAFWRHDAVGLRD